MAMHAVVTFLEDEDHLLRGIDKDFLESTKNFHKIPFCATFGVSCAGHFEEHSEDYYKNQGYSEEFIRATFRPNPYGHLDIIILSEIPHIQELLKIIENEIFLEKDVSFKKINHCFGPKENSKLEVWEIRIGDNNCLKNLNREYFGGSLLIKEHETVYKESKKRCGEIKFFWGNLAIKVSDFCEKNNFKEIDIQKRKSEIMDIWKKEA